MAFTRLLERIEGSVEALHRDVLTPVLVVRQSCAKLDAP